MPGDSGLVSVVVEGAVLLGVGCVLTTTSAVLSARVETFFFFFFFRFDKRKPSFVCNSYSPAPEWDVRAFEMEEENFDGLPSVKSGRRDSLPSKC